MLSKNDWQFLNTITPLQEQEGVMEIANAMKPTIDHMNAIMGRFPELTWEILEQIYRQWYELGQLEINGEIAMFDEFCEATRVIFERPLGGLENTKSFIHLVRFVESFHDIKKASFLTEKFRSYLPHIPQESIDKARELWKDKILSGPFFYSDNPHLFFLERDNEGSSPDLDYLKFFHERAIEDIAVDKWYEKFGKYCCQSS